MVSTVTPDVGLLIATRVKSTVQEVDPACERTIGVLTKLDLMDRGTDAVEVLQVGGAGRGGRAGVIVAWEPVRAARAPPEPRHPAAARLRH